MRKIQSVSLIVILFANAIGYFVSFTVQRYKVKAEVRQLIKAEKMKHTQRFAFTEEEYLRLKKVDNGKEFILNGGLYDVVKKERRDGKIILTAYYDHAETGLIDKLISYLDEETDTGKEKHTLPIFSLLEFVFYPNEWKCYDHSVCFHIPAYSSYLLTLSLDLASPPPDSCFS